MTDRTSNAHRMVKVETLIDQHAEAMRILPTMARQFQELFDEQTAEINGLRTELDLVRIERDQLRRDASARLQEDRYQAAVDYMAGLLSNTPSITAVVGEPVLAITTFVKTADKETRSAVYDAEMKLMEKFPEMKFDPHQVEVPLNWNAPPAFAFLTTRMTWTFLD